MSLKFLLRLRATGIPYRTTDQTEISRIDLLAPAGLITATLPPIADGIYSGEAVVE